MADEREPKVALTRISGSNPDRRAWIASAAMLATFAVLVGAGMVGRIVERPMPSFPTPSAAAVASPSGRTPSSSAAADRGATTGAARTFAVPQAGYQVTYAVDEEHQPTILDRGSVAIFGFGPRGADGSYDGTIRVSVGTPAQGAAILTPAGPMAVFGTTLEDLRAKYIAAESGRVLSRSAQQVGGQLSILVRIDDGANGLRAVALAVHGGRTFIVTATGFQGRYGGAADIPAEAGLQEFLNGFSFGTGLFVSRELGFQAPLPTDSVPFGLAPGVPDAGAYGLYVFGDGTVRPDGSYSHSIGVSVGSATHPGLVRVLRSAEPAPDPRRIWKASLVELQAAYLAAVGGRIGAGTTIRLDGELALLLEHPDGLGTAVLAIHRGRVYIQESTGADAPEPGPHFTDFLEGFAFLD
jgi:hypothetical protein